MVTKKSAVKKPAEIDLAKWMKPIKDNGEVPVIPDDTILVSNKLLPEVHAKLKALSQVERMYQAAIVNAALITYLDQKEQELGYDLLDYVGKESSSRVSREEVKSALLKKSK